jgi:lipopolysaccharide export system permease protein
VILFRYFSVAVLQSTFAVTLVLLLIVTSGRLAKYLSQASAGDLAPDLLLWIIFYRIPDFLPLILPLGLFVGVLLAYGRMYVESEMIVMSAAGISKTRILLITLASAFVLSAIVAFLTLWAAPAGLAKVESLLESSKRGDSLMLFRDGSFQSNSAGDSVAYVEHVDRNDTLNGVFLFQQKADGKLHVMRADSARIESLDQQYLTFEKGAMVEGAIGQNNYKATYFDSYTQKVSISEREEQVKLRIDALPTAAILGSSAKAHIAALHWRFSLPATVIVVGILAVALSKTNHRTGRYAKMLPAILLYLLYIVSLSATRDAMENGKLAGFYLWLVHGFYFGLALSILYADELRMWLGPAKRGSVRD